MLVLEKTKDAAESKSDSLRFCVVLHSMSSASPSASAATSGSYRYANFNAGRNKALPAHQNVKFG